MNRRNILKGFGIASLFNLGTVEAKEVATLDVKKVEDAAAPLVKTTHNVLGMKIDLYQAGPTGIKF
jgi:hypothetical protein